MNITPSESVILNGSSYSTPVAKSKVLAGRISMAILFSAVGVFLVYYFATSDQPLPYTLLLILMGLMFILVGLYIGLSNLSASGDDTFLLDNSGWVKAEPLAYAFIRAAVLANLEAGVVLAQPGEGGELVLQPTGKQEAWPPDTLEARLDLGQPNPLSQILKEWIGALSQAPSSRVVNLANIMLVIRGLALMTINRLTGSMDYRLADRSGDGAGNSEIIPLQPLLGKYRTERPDICNALDKSISFALGSLLHVSTGTHDGFSEPDPWEPELDPKKYQPRKQTGIITAAMLAVVAAGGLVGLYLLEQNYPLIRWVILFAAAVTLWQILLNLPLAFSEKIRKKVQSRSVVPVAMKNKSFVSLLSIFLVTSYLGLLPFVLYKANPLLGLGLGVLFVVVAYFWFTGMIGKKISRKVAASSEPVTSSAIPGPDLDTSEFVGGPVPFRVETLLAHDLPPAGKDTEELYQLPVTRSLAMGRYYKRMIGGVVVFTLLLIWGLWLSKSPRPDKELLSTIGILETALAVITGWYLFSKYSSLHIGYLMLAVFGMSSQEIDPEDKHKTKPQIGESATMRNRRLFVLGACWLLIPLFNLALMRQARPPALAWTLVVISMVFIALYFILLSRWKSLSETRYPWRGPFRLLALRVFGSPHLYNFLDLMGPWKYFGTLMRLDGPDTVGQKLSDVLHYVSGHLDESIVKTDQELDSKLAGFSYQPGSTGTFPVNSLQCTNATWKRAIDTLFGEADMIVMDLSALCERNQGIAFELTKCMNRFSMERMIFLVDSSTDREVLNNLLMKTCATIDKDSPNFGPGPLTIRLLDTGGMPSRDPGETGYAWRKRCHQRMSEQQLISLVLAAAHPPLRPVVDERELERSTIHWTDPFPSLNPWLWRLLSMLVLALMAYWILRGS